MSGIVSEKVGSACLSAKCFQFHGSKQQGTIDEDTPVQAFESSNQVEIGGKSEITSEKGIRGLTERSPDVDQTKPPKIFSFSDPTILVTEIVQCKKLLNLHSSHATEESETNSGLWRKRTVAVTGAGGFIASWIVKLLLQRGFFVRGTLRNLDVNTAHLKSLEGANERLELVEADILDFPSLLKVVGGCVGVFHTACPVPPDITDPEVQMLRPAVEGTMNVLRACKEAHVKRVVMTSSIGAVYMNPSIQPDQEVDESCWSDEAFLRGRKEWYCLAKLIAERTAWDYADAHGMKLVTICPPVTLGTMLQPRVNQSSKHILKYLDGSAKTYANRCQAYVDVKNAAEAHVLAFESPAASGRYLCCKWSLHRGEIVEALARMYPQYAISMRCKDDGQPRRVPLRFCSDKVEQLGLQFTSFDETLRNAVSSLQAKGMLHKKTNILKLGSVQPCSLSSKQLIQSCI
ncbi:cinnamoyl-CoA reductase 1 isoform X2 [Physcomitrium patens]|uniref:cinnamoyl-CoA reductase 1 isoform X2 n=1 Tax=Physcomitrium patens TaxID=3218 RepID=UPI000D164441|nr:cinnamoyl-CoA reductase 1-like isoform X2 [Physcomitrium patens]|eukprot:XP_024379667.1 cinnamoyl-CoA reductase 1-like isoform X2 [Physcomitrella patens]